ncbi:MAG: ABC transporter permease [candidate division KSB1 bacterium]|nr:ABC transporter permease [candidate division KSB1 bacterium]MDZ7365838.1 ABC transporter permease [candidate division KSB1 bacterium]MDZ7403927.1 ABC transporter permease [candidate division KSB1 bacterium]
MSKMWTVLRREYLARVKTKGFIIGTIVLPLVMLAMFVVPVLLVFLKSDESKQIVVIDQTGVVFDSLYAALDETNEAGQRLYNFVQQQVPDEELETAKKSLSARVNKGEIDGYIIIPRSVFENGSAEYYAKNVSNEIENDDLEDAISDIVTQARIQRRGLDAAKIQQMIRPIRLNTIRVKEGGKEEKDPGFTFAIAYFLGFFIYMAMFIYGAIVMRSVIEEKTSRVIESVISSVKPFQLMTGKIFGVGAVGLTQFLIWAAVMGLLSLYSLQMAALFVDNPASLQDVALPTVSLSALGFFVLFFVLGYFLFSTLYAGVGAMVNSEQEAQQMMLPISLLIVPPILLITYVISNPSSQTSVILSLVPFFAPILMLARLTVEAPPFWQIAVSIGLMIVTILGMTWIVGRIYRVGVLMYGKRPSLREIIRWIRYA